MKKHILSIITILIVALPMVMLVQVGVASAVELETTPGSSSIVSCSGVGAASDKDSSLPTCNWCTFVQLIGNMVEYSIYLAVILASLMFAYAGFLLLTNNGDSGKVTKAKEIFTRALFGAIAILAAWLIVNAIMINLAKGLGLGEGWNSITGCKEDVLTTEQVNYNSGTNNDMNIDWQVYTSTEYDRLEQERKAKLEAIEQDISESNSKPENFFDGGWGGVGI